MSLNYEFISIEGNFICGGQTIKNVKGDHNSLSFDKLPREKYLQLLDTTNGKNADGSYLLRKYHLCLKQEKNKSENYKLKRQIE
jgi:hypothetical protein